VRTLEAQMRQPLFNTHPVEMGLAGREATVLRALRADPSYARAFGESFGESPEPVTLGNLIRAIAAFERTLIGGTSPFDRYVFRGQHRAIGDPAKRGMALFYSPRLGCGLCHGGFNFTGRSADARHPRVQPQFERNGASRVPMRVPTLRNIALTAPYMHDGRFATLEDVVRHYEQGGAGRRFRLSSAQRADLIAFLESLTDASPEGSRDLADRTDPSR
jgi:cytochrome c peroxidase